jgi:putative Mg2+ transporter-C (MgtC) family protein
MMVGLIDFDYLLLLRLVAAAIFGGLIGLERGIKHHEAGLRTHIILCLGAASVMIVSECLVKQYGSGDIMRMGGQVISGIGFLGAGSIIVGKNRVKGLTTATGLWTTACVGIAVGSGYYAIAASIVALMLFAMFGLSSFSAKLASKSSTYRIKFDLGSKSETRKVLERLNDKNVEIISMELEEDEGDVFGIFEIQIDKKIDLNELIIEVTSFEIVKEFTNQI